MGEQKENLKKNTRAINWPILHYICFSWYKFDDHIVSEIEIDDVVSSEAYILFYSMAK